MNEAEFRNCLVNKCVKIKVVGDTISWLKRIEREIENGENANLPIGKYYMSTYRHALKQYIQFSDDVASNNQ